MENYSFKSVAFGGFDKQDVVRYLEQSSEKAAAAQQALEAEKTKKVKELIQKALSADGQETGELSPERLISELLFGGAKRRLSWFPEEERPRSAERIQKEASEDCLAAILVAYANMNIPGINEDAGKLAAELEPGDLVFLPHPAIAQGFLMWLCI